MAHPIPKLKGEERLFSIPYIDLHFNKKASLYCLISTVVAGLTVKVNIYLFLVLFVILNGISYTLASFTIAKDKFEGGNVPFDVFILRKLKYKKNKNIYIRRRDK